MTIQIKNLDAFYLSYDEPDAKAHWDDLVKKAPWAKHVHGVKGFDAAHKACANQSTSKWFITVDGDNYVDPKFFDMMIDVDTVPFDDRVYSWASRNIINGLVYGNGGIKCWHRDHVLRMKTHEIADKEQNKVDFCWYSHYVPMSGVYSTSHPNATPFQAWRAGFREGVKMCLANGKRVTIDAFSLETIRVNRSRLSVWMSVGSDVYNGLWAMWGARMGCWRVLSEPEWDYSVINDYDWFATEWEMISHNQGDQEEMLGKMRELGKLIRDRCQIPVAFLDPEASEFYKTVRVPPRDELYRRPR